MKTIVMLLVAALTLSFFVSSQAYGQEDPAKFPSKPITFVVPVPPGGPTDLAIRLITKEVEKYLKQPMVVVNKPGGALTVGTAAIATAKPDGYTIGYTGGPPLFFTPLLEKVPYDPVKDIRTIVRIGGFNFGVYVKADSPFKTFKDLMAFAKQNPKKLTFGTTGVNSQGHLMVEQAAKKEGVQITHIPFKGTPEVQTALLGGHVYFGAGDFNASLVEAKQIRLVMMLKDEPSAEYPGVPTIKDLYGLPYPMYISVICPRAVPDAIVLKLEDAFAKAMKEPGYVNGMKELRLPVMYQSGKDLDAYVAQSYAYYSKLFRELGIGKK
jgi:tripartite-type tricarboxylate transporter receptor subunit TctC